MSQKNKPSSVRHTRAIRVAESTLVPAAPPDPMITERLTELVHPATYAPMDLYHQLGLRDRLLNLPVMVALVISMIWRHIGSASELVRVLAQAGLLWVSPLQITQQALSVRLLNFPAILFERVLMDVLPQVQARWEARQRPLPPEVAWAQEKFGRLLIFDGSTLDSLLRKLRRCATYPRPRWRDGSGRCCTWAPACQCRFGMNPTRRPTITALWSVCSRACALTTSWCLMRAFWILISLTA